MPKYGIDVTFDAPLRYVYEWCTDFRDDDPLISGGEYPREIVRRSKDRFVWTQRFRSEDVERVGVRVVTLEPPRAWHNEVSEPGREGTFDYRLTRLGSDKTRLRITASVTYKSMQTEDKQALERSLAASWAKYREALQKDYEAGLGARA
jgi:hypothetical protein